MVYQSLPKAPKSTLRTLVQSAHKRYPTAFDENAIYTKKQEVERELELNRLLHLVAKHYFAELEGEEVEEFEELLTKMLHETKEKLVEACFELAHGVHREDDLLVRRIVSSV